MDTARVIGDERPQPRRSRRWLIALAIATLGAPLASGSAGAMSKAPSNARAEAAPLVIHHANGHDCLAGRGRLQHRARLN